MTINLNSIKSVNIDTTTFSVKADKVTLGDKDNNEPILLGNKTVKLLDELLEKLITLSGPFALQTPYKSPSGDTLNTGVIASAVQLHQTATTLKNQINSTGKDSIKSKTSFTK